MQTYGPTTEQCGPGDLRTGVFGKSYITRTGSFTGNLILIFFTEMHTFYFQLDNISNKAFFV